MARPRWEYRGAHHRLRELGWEVNRKRLQRLSREEGLRACRSPSASAAGSASRPCPSEQLRAERSNHVCAAFDFQFDQSAGGRALKLFNAVDEFTREALVMLIERSIDADTVVATLERLVAELAARSSCGATTVRR